MSVEAAPVDETAAEKKRGWPLALFAAIAAGIGGAGGGYFLTPILLGPKGNLEERDHSPKIAADADEHQQKASETENEEASTASDSRKGKSTHGAKRKTDPKPATGHSAEAACADECGGEFTVVGETAFYAPQTLIVSIRPGARVRHLKIALAVETAPDANAAFNDNALRLRDTLTAYLRTIEPSALEDPAAFDDIRAQLARRVSAVVAPAPVRAVLITEFILT